MITSQQNMFFLPLCDNFPQKNSQKMNNKIPFTYLQLLFRHEEKKPHYYKCFPKSLMGKIMAWKCFATKQLFFFSVFFLCSLKREEKNLGNKFNFFIRKKFVILFQFIRKLNCFNEIEVGRNFSSTFIWND